MIEGQFNDIALASRQSAYHRSKSGMTNVKVCKGHMKGYIFTNSRVPGYLTDLSQKFP